MIMGAAAGAVGMALPVMLKTRFGADEVVTTLLLNFIIIIFLQMLLEGVLKDPMGLGWPQSAPILDQGMLPQLIDRMRVHSGLLIALFAAGVAQFMLMKSVWGFRLRAVGENSHAARYAGIKVNRSLFFVAIISGGLAGLAGVSEVAGLRGYLTSDLSPGFFFTGIFFAMFSFLSPFCVVFSACFFSSLFFCADFIIRSFCFSSYFSFFIFSLSLLSFLVVCFFSRFFFLFISNLLLLFFLIYYNFF